MISRKALKIWLYPTKLNFQKVAYNIQLLLAVRVMGLGALTYRSAQWSITDLYRLSDQHKVT
jgi:hypothetical protein